MVKTIRDNLGAIESNDSKTGLDRVGYWGKYKRGVLVWIGPMSEQQMLKEDRDSRHNFMP